MELPKRKKVANGNGQQNDLLLAENVFSNSSNQPMAYAEELEIKRIFVVKLLTTPLLIK